MMNIMNDKLRYEVALKYFIVPLVNVCVSSEDKHTLLAGTWSIALEVRTGSNCVAGKLRIRFLQSDKPVSEYEDDDNEYDMTMILLMVGDYRYYFDDNFHRRDD
jgi:hypothetical protein